MKNRCRYPNCVTIPTEYIYIENASYCPEHYERVRRAKIPLKDLLIEIQRSKPLKMNNH
jgi:hypothetical protein